MRIIFDNIVYSLQRYGGISVVWNNLIMRILQREHDVHFLEHSDAQLNISRQLLPLPKEKIHSLSTRLLMLRRYLNPQVPKELVADQKPFIFHSSYFRLCNHPKAINITTVHDFTYEFYVRNWFKRTLHCWQKHAAIRRADHVVCISENTRRDLLRILPDINPDKISVIYNGVERGSFYRLPNTTHQDFALFVGRRDEYKNFDAIVQPLAELGIPLHIVGPDLSPTEQARLNALGLRYKMCGIIGHNELNVLYNQALFLIFPSYYEGFGLPVLEAQMAGCPVMAYNASSIPEVIGDPTLMLDAFTTQTMAPLVERFRNPDTRASIVANGLANASRFSWDKMAEQYLQLYQTLCS